MAPVTFYRKIIETGEAGFSVLVMQLALQHFLGAEAHNQLTAVYDQETVDDVETFYVSRKHNTGAGKWDDWSWDTVASVVEQHPTWVTMTGAQKTIDGAASVGQKIALVAYEVYQRYRMNVHYAEVRPIPVCIAQAACKIITTDCSGFATDCYKIGGGPDPNGLNWDGQGYTGDEWDHGVEVALADLDPGDLVFYTDGSAPTTHVAVYYGLVAGEQYVVSNGEYPMQFLPVALAGSGLSIVGARRYV